MSKTQDEYVWSNYAQEYSEQLKGMIANDNIDFFARVEGGKMLNAHRLHPNWMELYDAVTELNPQSVFECGFGGGYHLKNIRSLMPDVEIGGCDLLPEQLEKAKEFSQLPSDIISNLFIADFTKYNAHENSKHSFEFVYSMAVVMHLSTENARSFLRNMGELSSKYIFMVEGVRNHENWYDFVRETLPEFEFVMRTKYVDNGILLIRK